MLMSNMFLDTHNSRKLRGRVDKKRRGQKDMKLNTLYYKPKQQQIYSDLVSCNIRSRNEVAICYISRAPHTVLGKLRIRSTTHNKFSSLSHVNNKEENHASQQNIKKGMELAQKHLASTTNK